MNGYPIQRGGAGQKVLYYGVPMALGAFVTDQVYRLVPRFMPMDLSKRTSRVLLGSAVSVLATLATGTIFAEDRSRQDMMAVVFLGGMASVVMRETFEYGGFFPGA